MVLFKTPKLFIAYVHLFACFCAARLPISVEFIVQVIVFSSHQSRDRLATLVAEHLDHLHYVNDILLINIDTLNDVLSDQLLNRLLIPLYVYSLTKRKRYDARTVSDF